MRYQLDSSSGSVYSLNYHLIFCTKYRRKVLTEQISNRLKDIIVCISKDFQVKIIEQETDKDHMHVLFKTKPTINMTKYINSVKGVSSRILFQEFPEIKIRLWKGHLWSKTYCLLTTVKDSKLLLQTTLDVLKRYVESQGSDEDKENKIEDRKEQSSKCSMYGW